MSKMLKIYLSLICLLIANFSLMASDFTISGKVSFIEEAVPLPFYDVNIADGGGKYVTTVKTALNGTYEATFDIPDEEKVDFEISVIDRCTGNSIISAFGKDGNSITINFVICHPGNEPVEEICKANFDYAVKGTEVHFIDISEGNITAWEWDFGDGTISNEPAPIHDYGIEAEYKVILKVTGENCEDSESRKIDFSKDEKGDCICNTQFEPVCVKTEFGIILPFPNACAAECVGYTEFVDCDENPVDSTCACPEYYHPVCVIIEDSIQLEFPNECFALCEGYYDFFDCNGEEPSYGDCDLIGVSLPVCVVLDDGEIISFPNPCFALEEGYELGQLTFCESEYDGKDSLNCAMFGMDFPVCAIDANGDTITYANPCEAYTAGVTFDQFTLCDDVNIGGGEGIDCGTFGIDIPIPVCIELENGEKLELLLCEALIEGFSFDQIEFCDEGFGSLDSINCEELGINIPICIVGENGDTINFPTPCDALQAGFNFDQFILCDGGLLGGEVFDCDAYEIDLPIPVCVSINGETLNFPSICTALAEGYDIDQLEICGDFIDLDDSLDCSILGIEFPVCVWDVDGNQTTFSNPCNAINAGFTLAQLTFCDDYDDGGNGFDCASLGIGYPIQVCVNLDNGEKIELNICDAFLEGYSLDQIELCDGSMDSIDCAALGLEIPICVIDDTTGDTTTFNSPCEALSAGFNIHQLTFCDSPYDEEGFPPFPGVDSDLCQAFFFFDQDEKDAMTISFHDLSFGTVADWAWDFGDGDTGEGKEVVHSYTEPGLYEVTLTITGEECESQFTMIVFTDLDAWYSSECQALFVPTVDGLSVNFWEISQGNVTSWFWDFGDGTTSTDSAPNHTYEEMGDYIVSLIVTTANSCTSVFELSIDLGDGLTGGVVADLAKAFGITDTKEENVLIEKAELFPNPVQNELKFALKFTESTQYEVRIQSINGNAIYRQNFYALNGENVARLDVSSLSVGIYVAQVITDRGIKAMKFVKN